MNAILDPLYALQPVLLKSAAASEKKQARIEALRQHVPAPVLEHFLRMIAAGHRGVAPVRHGVCGECHIRVPSATLYGLARPTDIYLCESCGCYLVLPPDEQPAVPPVVPHAQVVLRKRGRSKAVVSTSG